MARKSDKAAARGKKVRSSLSRRLVEEDAAKRVVSKSTQRRQKQREREQLAGNKAGMQDLSDMVTSMESDMLVQPEQHNSKPTGHTSKSRRAILRRERERQPMILADLRQNANPFAALRTHARNTLDLAPRKVALESDEQMNAA